MSGRTLAEVLADHLPVRHTINERVMTCSCAYESPEMPRLLRFHRDEHGNARKDGADEQAWAEHVAEVIHREGVTP